MPVIDVNQINISMSLIGGWIVIVGLITYILKERLYLSEALLALVFGILVGPSALNWFDPASWTSSAEGGRDLTFEIVRIAIGIQVLFAGIALPKAYLKKEWQSLSVLLLPVMVCAWFMSSLAIWALFHRITFLEALVVGACVTPTDPVLANSITKGKFAEQHVPAHVRNIIVAESGANDGLGFPFMFLALYLILYKHENHDEISTLGQAIGKWFYETWLYSIVLSIVEGFVIGHLARIALNWARRHHYIDHDNFLGYGIGLALFTLGVIGLVGGDDLLCCFIAGNALSWDDAYRVDTEDDSFQDVIDSLLNTATFIYIGAIIPWSQLNNADLGFSVWRFVVMGIMILVIRRLPWVLAFKGITPAFSTYREAAFAGWFGPIGVSAIYYVQVALRELPDDDYLHNIRSSIIPIVYFVVFCSILVHGCTIPASKSFGRARTFTRTLSIASARSGRNTNTVSDSAAITPKADSTNTATATPAPSRPASPGARDVRFAPLTTPYKATVTEGFSSADPNLHAGERAFYEGEQVSIEACDGEAHRVVTKKAFDDVNGASEDAPSPSGGSWWHRRVARETPYEAAVRARDTHVASDAAQASQAAAPPSPVVSEEELCQS